jgi:MFS family permease
MTPTDWAWVALAAAGTFTFLGIFAKIRAVAIFVGLCVVGFAGTAGGWIAHIVADITGLINNGVTLATGRAFAVGGLIIAVVLGIILVHDLHWRNSAGKRTTWVAIAFAIMCITGATGIQMLNHLPSSVRQSVTTAVTPGQG